MLEPTAAERTRTLVASSTHAAFACLDSDGVPVVDEVPVIDDAAGVPVTVVSNLSALTDRGRRDPRAGVSLAGGAVLVQGYLEPVPGMQQLELQDRFLERHPGHVGLVDSLDFSWWRLEPVRIRLSDPHRPTELPRWMMPADVAAAEPDPLQPDESRLVAEINERLAGDAALVALRVGGYWNVSEAEVCGLDRYGLRLDVVEPGGRRTVRVPFPNRLDAVDEIHAAVAGLVAAARAGEEGIVFERPEVAPPVDLDAWLDAEPLAELPPGDPEDVASPDGSEPIDADVVDGFDADADADADADDPDPDPAEDDDEILTAADADGDDTADATEPLGPIRWSPGELVEAEWAERVSASGDGPS